MTTKTETIELAPSADLDGSWEGNAPLLVGSTRFEPYRVLAALSDAYDQGDGAASYEGGTFVLPDVGADTNLDSIEVVDTSVWDTGSKLQNHYLPYPSDPSKPILEGDLILVACISWTVTITGRPATPTGYTFRATHKDAGEQHSPRLTIFWKYADGTESGTVDLDVSAVSPQGGQLSAVMVVYRGVDPTTPFAASTSGPVHANAPNPDSPSITPSRDNARVLSIVGWRKWGGDPNAQPPASFQLEVEQFQDGSRGVSIAGLETASVATDPGPWQHATEAYTAITEALNPAQTFGDELSLIVGVAVADSSGGGSAGSTVYIEGRDEVQTITSTLGSGTFTLTFDGETTGAIDFDADAAAIQTALEALSNVASGDVEVSGGPLDVLDVHVEFLENLGLSGQPTMTTSSGSVSVSETIAGKSQDNLTGFPLATAESPRTNGSNSPQIDLYEHSLTYESGRTLRFEVDSSGTVKTWAAFLLIGTGVFTTLPIQDETEITPGEGQSTDLGSLTPTRAGARVLTVFGKALSSGNYPVAAAGVSRPPGRTRAAGAVGDSITIDALLSGPVPDVAAYEMGTVAWPIIEKYSAVSVTIRPNFDANGSPNNTYEVLAPGTDSWMELAHTTSNFYHVVEFGLDSVPSDAVLVAGTINFTHESDDEHEIQVVLVGINSDDTIEPCEEQGRGFVALPLGSVVQAETVRWTETADGSPLNDFDRLGVAFVSTSTAPALTEHRVYTAELELEYVAGGPVVTNVVGPTDAGDPLATWDYESAGGLPQVYYEVMVIRGAGQDPLLAVDDDPWQGTTGNKVYHSGLLTGPDVRAFSLTDYPLYNGENTVGVRSWTRINGALVSSDWATDDFNITGTPPSAPTFSSGPALNADTGAVEMTVNTPAAVSRAFVAKSTDGGTTFALVPHGGPFEITPSSTATVRDPNPVTGEAALYRVIVDDGETSESTWVNWSGDYTPTLTEWYLADPTDENLAMDIFVVDVEVERTKRTVRSRQEGRAAVGSSGQLGDIIRATIRVITPTERATLDSMIQSDNVLWLADPLGRSWYVRPGDSSDYQMLRTAPTGADLANIRDAHDIAVELVEVGL